MFFRNENGNPKFPTESSSKSTTVDNMIIPCITLGAEILWTLQVVTNHFSLRSCLQLLIEWFQVMFLDSKMIKLFQLSKTKWGCKINYSISLFKIVNSPYCQFYKMHFPSWMRKSSTYNRVKLLTICLIFCSFMMS